MKKPKFIPEFADIPKKRTRMPELHVDERRLNFKEVELGFTEELAKQEAARCLSCRRCIGCGLCLAECDPCAIVYDEKASEIAIQADAVIFTPEAGQFSAAKKRDLGYGECWNVVTSYELERMLSPTGPFGGLVLRPFDGEIPARIGFIQCVGSRDEAIGANYCSSECCSRTISQAMRARESIGQVEVHVFHRGLRPAGKTSELQLKSIEGQQWVSLVEAGVTSVREDPESGTVTVGYTSGGVEAEAAFDLVVLAVGIEARRDFRRFARVGGVGINKYGFVDPGIINMITCKDGVAFAGTIKGPQGAGQSVVDALAGASKALTSSAPGGGEAQPGKRPTGAAGRPVIFACEYGMTLAGKDTSPADQVEAGGFTIEGSYPFLCYMSGRQEMAKKLDGASGLVVLGCHSGSHEEMFEHLLGLPGGAVTILDRAELGVSTGVALERAIRDLESGGARAGRVEAGEAGRAGEAPRDRAVAILGGGIAGLAAASELLRRKVKTIIVSQSAVPGDGFSRLASGQAADQKTVLDFVKTVWDHPDAQALGPAEVTSFGREDGAINLTVRTATGEERLSVGALIIATGARPYVPDDFPSGTDLVITQDDLRASLKAGGAPWKRIVMLQCVGARDAEHPYCSRFCCRQALTNALLLKQVEPDAEVTILHKGIRVFGFEEDLLTDAADRGVSFVEIKDRPSVEAGNPVRVKGVSAAGQALSIDCDALALSVGHAADEGTQKIAGMTGARLDALGFFETCNPLVRPFATAAQGIFVCGFARAPVTLEEAFLDGVGAAAAVCEYLKI